MAVNISNLAMLQVRQIMQSASYQPSCQLYDVTSYLCRGWSIWQLSLTILLVFVTYDQGDTALLKLALCVNRLTSFLVMYIKRKGSIAGPAFKIPFMGPFLQALNPKFDSYLAQWASGPLSCVSVFHK
jgi:C-22 sterol desaturase